MKTKTLKFTAILLIFAGVFTACNGKEPPIAPFLSIDKTAITATAEGGVFHIAVSSSGSWTAVVEDVENHLWCTLINASGTNDGVITVNIAENTLFAIRRGTTVKVSMGDLSEYVLISQEATGGYVAFEPCYYNYNGELEMVLMETPYFSRGEAVLFKDYVISELLRPGIPSIIYYSERNITYMLLPPSPQSGLLRLGLICNFPDFAKEWLNYKNGIRVYVEGVAYTCSFPGWAVVMRFCYVLTRLVKK